ncbi:hypothetical protein EV2_009492 [Malus domestica]
MVLGVVQNQSADMKRANISCSKGAGDFIGNGQARRNPAGESQPHHLRHPNSHAPWHCHLSSATVAFASENPINPLPPFEANSSQRNRKEFITRILSFPFCVSKMS